MIYEGSKEISESIFPLLGSAYVEGDGWKKRTNMTHHHVDDGKSNELNT